MKCENKYLGVRKLHRKEKHCKEWLIWARKGLFIMRFIFAMINRRSVIPLSTATVWASKHLEK
jgi:hypothetical protein